MYRRDWYRYLYTMNNSSWQDRGEDATLDKPWSLVHKDGVTMDLFTIRNSTPYSIVSAMNYLLTKESYEL